VVMPSSLFVAERCKSSVFEIGDRETGTLLNN
jgi:hypothetical protein